MWRRVLLLVLGAGIISTTNTYSQIKKQFSVEDDEKIKKIDLDFSVNSGTCYIKPGQGTELLNVYSNQDYNNYSHSFDKEVNNGVCQINLALEDDKSEGLSQSISYRMFGKSDEDPDKIWKVYLSTEKYYTLDLNYGIGDADIDLSGLSVEKLKIKTGSADISIGYKDEYNNIEMDTFFVKVDLGSVSVNNLNHSRSKNVIADIGFGNLMLDYSDQPQMKSNVYGSVGAGNLMIILPEEDTPVMVKVKDSWLCRVRLTKSFTKHGEKNNTFVNEAYYDNAENLLTFNLDVSMGSIVFKEK